MVGLVYEAVITQSFHKVKRQAKNFDAGILKAKSESFLKAVGTEYELVNKLFEPFEQVSQMQAQLLEASFSLMVGGPAQTHVGTGGGGSSSDMLWGEKKNDNNLTTSRRKR